MKEFDIEELITRGNERNCSFSLCQRIDPWKTSHQYYNIGGPVLILQSTKPGPPYECPTNFLRGQGLWCADDGVRVVAFGEISGLPEMGTPTDELYRDYDNMQQAFVAPLPRAETYYAQLHVDVVDLKYPEYRRNLHFVNSIVGEGNEIRAIPATLNAQYRIGRRRPINVGAP